MTGAPASGKTGFLERLAQEPQLSGFVFLPELARQIISEQPELRDNWPAFHEQIYLRQVKREQELKETPFLTDRGTVDAFAFHRETMKHFNTSLSLEYKRYTAVIQLGSSAALGEEYYRTDEIRTESTDEALAIERALKKVWSDHPHYCFVAPNKDFEAKYEECKRIVLLCAGRLEKMNNPEGKSSN